MIGSGLPVAVSAGRSANDNLNVALAARLRPSITVRDVSKARSPRPDQAEQGELALVAPVPAATVKGVRHRQGAKEYGGRPHHIGGEPRDPEHCGNLHTVWGIQNIPHWVSSATLDEFRS